MFSSFKQLYVNGSPCQDASSQPSAREFGWIRPRPGLLETLLIQLYIFSQQTFQAIPRRLIEFSFQLMPSSPRSHHQLNRFSAAPAPVTQSERSKATNAKVLDAIRNARRPNWLYRRIDGSYGAKHKQRRLNRGARSCNLTRSGGEPNERLRAVSDSDA